MSINVRDDGIIIPWRQWHNIYINIYTYKYTPFTRLDDRDNPREPGDAYNFHTFYVYRVSDEDLPLARLT